MPTSVRQLNLWVTRWFIERVRDFFHGALLEVRCIFQTCRRRNSASVTSSYYFPDSNRPRASSFNVNALTVVCDPFDGVAEIYCTSKRRMAIGQEHLATQHCIEIPSRALILVEIKSAECRSRSIPSLGVMRFLRTAVGARQ